MRHIGDMHRLFIGLRPPRPVREALMHVMSGVPGARWQSGEQLHVTLRFVGEVDRRVAEDVADALATIAAPPVELRLSGVGSFDARGRVNALWAGLRPHDDITHLHHKVDRALVRAGLPPEGRAYLPHITLARFGRDGGPVDRWLADNAALSGPPFTVEQMTLFESHLGSGGASYAVVERYPLGG